MTNLAFIPPLFLWTIGVAIAIICCSLAWVRGRNTPYKAKVTAYECGFDGFSSKESPPIHIPYYRVALLFIIFDVELVFLIPFAPLVKSIGTFGFCSMMLFLFILTVGFVYEWSKGGLEWS